MSSVRGGWYAAISGLSAGCLAFALSFTPSPPPDEPAPAAPVVDADLCAGGVEGPVRVQLVPTESRSVGAEERFVLAFESSSTTDDRPTVQRSLRVLTPDGEEAAPPRRFEVAQASREITEASEHPLPKLDDGWYRVVATAQTETGQVQDQVYLRVQEGRQMPVSFEEWYLESGAADVGGPDEPARKGGR